MAEPHRLWLVRHGETEWSKSGQHTGRTDIPLTAEGERQGKALGRHLAGQRFALVLTSPLGRARETCRLAGFGGVAEVSDDLLEWNYGVYEGRKTADIRVEQPGWSIWTTPVAQGETVEQVGERALPEDPRRLLDRAAADPRPEPHAWPGVGQPARLRARDARHPGLEPGLAIGCRVGRLRPRFARPGRFRSIIVSACRPI